MLNKTMALTDSDSVLRLSKFPSLALFKASQQSCMKIAWHLMTYVTWISVYEALDSLSTGEIGITDHLFYSNNNMSFMCSMLSSLVLLVLTI